MKMDILRYLNWIEKISQSDPILSNKTIKANKYVFDIERLKTDELREIKEYLHKLISLETTKSVEDYDKFLEKGKSLIDGDMIKLNKERRKFKQPSINGFDKLQYDFLKNPFSQKNVRIFENIVTQNFGKGNYFGDLTSNNKRLSSIFCEEETHLAFIDYEDFNFYISKTKCENQCLVSEKICQLFLGNTIESNDFEENYLDYYAFGEAKKGDFLITVDSPLSYIYLIIEGIVDFSIIDSALKLNMIFKKLINQFHLEENYPSIKNEDAFFNDINNQNVLRKTNHFKILESENFQIIGLMEYFNNMSNSFNVQVISEKLKYYRISDKNLNSLLTHNNDLLSYLKKYSSEFVHRISDNINQAKFDLIEKYSPKPAKKRNLIKFKSEILERSNSNIKTIEALNSKVLNLKLMDKTKNNFIPTIKIIKPDESNSISKVYQKKGVDMENEENLGVEDDQKYFQRNTSNKKKMRTNVLDIKNMNYDNSNFISPKREKSNYLTTLGKTSKISKIKILLDEVNIGEKRNNVNEYLKPSHMSTLSLSENKASGSSKNLFYNFD